MVSEDVRQKLRLCKLGDKNPMKRPEVRLKMVATSRSRGLYSNGGSFARLWALNLVPQATFTKERRESLRVCKLGGKNPMKDLGVRNKVSKAISEKYINGEIRYKGGWFYSKKNGKLIYYRCSYELLAYGLLEKNNEVSFYFAESLYIEYPWADNSVHRYIPDILVFYTDGSKGLIEVKPIWKLKLTGELAKIAVGRKYALEHNMTFNVWTEVELGLEEK